MEEAAAATATERKRPRAEAAAPPQRADGAAPLPRAAAAGQAQAQNVYVPIANAPKVSTANVFLFAAVAEIGASVHSRGTDFTVTLRVVDQSSEAAISVTFFAEKLALLPRVRATGDLISLQKVEISMYEEEYFVKFKKNSSAFALFEGKESTECRPYQKSKKYRGTKYDSVFLSQMRTWLLNPLPRLNDLELHLWNVNRGSTFDVVCKVLHVREAPNGEWVFYIWDGTDIPAIGFQDCSLESELVESAPLCLEEPPLPREVLYTMPRVGTVLRVFVNKFLKEVLHLQNKVYWARFCNIACKQESGMWKGISLPSSRLRLLSNADGSVVDRMRMYDRRLADKILRQPMAILASNVAGTDYETEPYATLMVSLTREQVTHKFKTLVRVVAACPCRTSDLHSLVTGNFYLRLTLEDPTARIHAYVHKDDGVKFFGGVLTGEALIKKMKKLLGIPEDCEEGAPLTRNPPWIWCCLKSFHLDENDPWGSRRYRIFGTEIRD